MGSQHCCVALIWLKHAAFAASRQRSGRVWSARPVATTVTLGAGTVSGESGAANPAWIAWTADTADPQLFWFRVCWPTCKANARFEALLTAEHHAFVAIVRVQGALAEALGELAWAWQWGDA